MLSLQEDEPEVYSVTAVSHDPSKYDYIERDQPLIKRVTGQLDREPDRGDLVGGAVVRGPGSGCVSESAARISGDERLGAWSSADGPCGAASMPRV